MGMSSCEDCGQNISDQAKMCIKCGRPLESTNKSLGIIDGPWAAATRSKTLINLFAIAMMSCSSILGMSATQVVSENSLTAFTYTLHIFLAVTGMFFVTILFCRKGIHHPDDLAKAKREGINDVGEDKPIVAAVLIVLMLIAYGLFQYSKS
jgi:heme/copper-type cytochrome/quinol oxidase subunit 2